MRSLLLTLVLVVSCSAHALDARCTVNGKYDVNVGADDLDCGADLDALCSRPDSKLNPLCINK